MKEAPSSSEQQRSKPAQIQSWVGRFSEIDEVQADELFRSMGWSWQHYFSPAAVLDILKALEHEPDIRAIPHVERMIKLAARTPDQKRVHAAAHACLTILRAAAEKAHADRKLLRYAAPPVAPTDGLVRPAARGSSVDPQGLVRPTSLAQAPQEAPQEGCRE